MKLKARELDRRVCFFSSRRRHTRSLCDWSSDVCSSDLIDVRIEMDAEPRQASAQRQGRADAERRPDRADDDSLEHEDAHDRSVGRAERLEDGDLLALLGDRKSVV